jgi:hypothetical protein
MGSYVPPSNAQTRFVRLPKPHHVKRARPRHTDTKNVTSNDTPLSEVELSKLDPNSKERYADLDAINRAADEELRKKLVICRGCTQPEPDDQLSSIWPTRAAQGYLTIQKTLRSLSLPAESTSSSGLQ